MATINPYIHFQNDKCRDAMNFYKQCLGGELSFMTVAESGAKDKMPPGMPEGLDDKIMHAELKVGGKTVLMGADMMMPETFKIGDTMTVSVAAENEAEAKDLFAKLSAGGKVSHELTMEFWGSLFGSFTDKFGIDWMVTCDMPKK